MRGILIARIVLLTLCATIAFGAKPLFAQLSASFTSSTVEGCAPVVVRFTDNSTGNPSGWRWDLGNGTISFLQNPATTYFNPGTYAIKLVISNGSQKDSVIRTNYITVHANPVANFSSSATSGCYPLNVQFKDESEAGSGNIVSWEWDFGDGTASREQHPSHIYTSAGSFNVTLRIRNSNGCTQTISRSNYITLTQGVKAAFDFSAPNNCKPPASIRFTNTSSGTGTLSYQWNFGDGSSSTDPNPTHAYTSTGIYTVKLVVRNNTGCVDSIIKTNSINIGTVKPDFDMPALLCAGQAFTITNTSAPTPNNAAWSFSDGSIASGVNTTKIFAAAGNYTIKMVADFGACKDSVTKPVQVLARPAAAFSAAGNKGCKAPLPVSFTAQATGATGYQWSFGDGGASTEPNPVHIYSAAGEYDVTLVVTNAAGCTDTVVQKGFVHIMAPQVSITNTPQEGCVPYNFRPSITVKSADAITGYYWTFGDGATSTDREPTHTYLQAGTYTVKLVYTTAGGCKDSVSATDAVRVGNKPAVNFSATPPVSCAQFPINFKDLSTGDKADHWLWYFGDGGTSSDQNPNHIYSDTGYFNVKLVAWSNGCRDSLTVPRLVFIKPPVARFEVSFDCSGRLTRTFKDLSLGATSWSWNFGDGNSSTQKDPVHTYAAPGSYLVQLTVKNDQCEHTTTRQVIVISEKADFTASETEVCKGSSITLNAVNSDPLHVSSYAWSITRNNASYGNPTGQSVKFTFNDAGQYNIRLVVTDINGCKEELLKPLFIQVYGPTADFKPDNPAVCPGATISFTDQSQSDGTHPIQKWAWDYGDGTVETLTGGPFSHTYTMPGIYNVQLTVTDNKGCSHTRVLSKAVNISRPVVQFNSPDTQSCVDKPVRFLNQSVSSTGIFTWYFGDGQTSSSTQPIHHYMAEGDYTVKLVVKDMYGCTDSLTRPAYIVIRNPVPAFTVNDSTTSCPPLVVTFTNQSQHFSKVEWDFGDGNRSDLPNPTHFYTYPGNYRAKLVITSPGGCQDSAFKNIIVKGPRGTFTYDITKGCVPVTVRFTGSTNDVASFIWDFNDGSIAETGGSTASHTYNTLGDYLPKMILEDPQGCRVPVTGKDTIHVYGVEAKFGAGSQLVCDSGFVQFTDASVSNDLITGYQWKFGDGGTSTQRNPSHYYRQPGLHQVELTVTTLTGCRDMVQLPVPVKVVPSPATAIQSADGACIPAQFTFSGQLTKSDTSALQWRWDFGNGATATGQHPAPVTYKDASSYEIKLITINSSGCADTVSKKVEAWPLPAIDAGPDQTICRGNNIILPGSGAREYTWTPAQSLSCTNCATPLASPLVDMRYKVKGKNIYGCEAVDSVLIKVKQPFTIEVHKGDTLCKGQTLQLFAKGAELYTWSPAAGLDNPGSDQPKARPGSSTVYQVVGHDDHNCFTDTGYVPVMVYPYPVIDAGKDTNVAVGSSVTLHPVFSADVKEYRWYPSTWLSCTTCPSPVASPRQTITYTLEAKNEGGCVSRDLLSLFVFCNNSNLFVPNTFSPNSNGHNDVFYPRGKGVFSIRSMRIFNRWGDLVFEQMNFMPNDASKGWNGMHKGKAAPQDVYIYTLEIICENNTIFNEKGNITLIR